MDFEFARAFRDLGGMMSRRPSIPVTEGLYGVTAFLVVIGLLLQLLPSGGQLEARTTVVPNAAKPPAPQAFGPASDVASADSLREERTEVVPEEPLPEMYRPIIALNIFSPERRPPRTRYALKEKEGDQADRPPRVSVRESPRGPRLFGVTLRASGASALIDADPRIPGAEIYRIGDPIAGGRLVEIGPSSVVIERKGGRQVIRLEAARPENTPVPDPPNDSLAMRKNDER